MGNEQSSGGSNRKVRVGVVGGGFGGAFFWHEDPNSVVEAVTDLNPARRDHLKNVYQCDKSYDSMEEMIKDKNVDAVAVFSGAPDHVRHAVAAMKAGKHVISAVPAALTLEECAELRDTVEQTGLTYMMAETSYYRQTLISARKFLAEGQFGEIFYTEAEYHHAGLEPLWFIDGKWTWRHGYPPMLYPTHSTSLLIGLTGERLTSVSCLGWGDDDPVLKGNPYNNPFWNETALFKTDKDHAFRVAVFWKGAHGGTERAQWYGDKMSLFMGHPNGVGPKIVRAGELSENDDGGFVRQHNVVESYDQPNWWTTDMLPEPLRHGGGHDGSQPFLTHEFIDAIVNERRPAVDVYEAIAYTAPGIVAHESALRGGELMKIPSFDRR